MIAWHVVRSSVLVASSSHRSTIPVLQDMYDLADAQLPFKEQTASVMLPGASFSREFGIQARASRQVLVQSTLSDPSHLLQPRFRAAQGRAGRMLKLGNQGEQASSTTSAFRVPIPCAILSPCWHRSTSFECTTSPPGSGTSFAVP